MLDSGDLLQRQMGWFIPPMGSQLLETQNLRGKRKDKERGDWLNEHNRSKSNE